MTKIIRNDIKNNNQFYKLLEEYSDLIYPLLKSAESDFIHRFDNNRLFDIDSIKRNLKCSLNNLFKLSNSNNKKVKINIRLSIINLKDGEKDLMIFIYPKWVKGAVNERSNI